MTRKAVDLLLLLLLLALASVANVAFAEQEPPVSGDLSTLPTYVVGAGMEANPSGLLVSIAVRISKTNLYSWSTINTPLLHQTSGQPQILASVRTGVAYVAAHSGSCFLFLLGDAGVAGANGTSSAAMLGTYSAGRRRLLHAE